MENMSKASSQEILARLHKFPYFQRQLLEQAMAFVPEDSELWIKLQAEVGDDVS